MRSDYLDEPLLSPDYNVPWSQLFRDFMQLVLAKRMIMTTWDDSFTVAMAACIKVLGVVLEVDFISLGQRTLTPGSAIIANSEDSGQRVLVSSKQSDEIQFGCRH